MLTPAHIHLYIYIQRQGKKMKTEGTSLCCLLSYSGRRFGLVVSTWGKVWFGWEHVGGISSTHEIFINPALGGCSLGWFLSHPHDLGLLPPWLCDRLHSGKRERERGGLIDSSSRQGSKFPSSEVGRQGRTFSSDKNLPIPFIFRNLCIILHALFRYKIK